MTNVVHLMSRASRPDGLSRSDALELARAGDSDLARLTDAAAALRDSVYGSVISYSRKVFIPLTHLCRDVCHYCTFAEPSRAGRRAYMTPDEVLAVARAGQAVGCKEALFTLGDKPESRYRAAREELTKLGYGTTLEYVADMARLVYEETGLLPHVNPGVMTGAEISMLKRVSVSQGLMLESSSERLCEKGGPHFGSPDKHPAARLETIRQAGELRAPITTGLLLGIGETREEFINSLLDLRRLHRQYGHIQEVIIQNFRAKPGTKMVDAPEPGPDAMLWAVATARLVLGPHMNIQAPPNLSPDLIGRLIGAGINDWGGISPVTPDHVNPEAPWPHLESLAAETKLAGKTLVERLAVYPEFIFDESDWIESGLRSAILGRIDAQGYARTDSWSPGDVAPPPDWRNSKSLVHAQDKFGRLLSKAAEGHDISESQVTELFQAQDGDFERVCEAADRLRQEVNGEVVSYVVNRNINYTNVCYFRCGFCAFSKGKLAENLRGRPYDLEVREIVRRAQEAKERGATEVCMQGGIHPDYTGETYLEICRAVKQAVPDMHIHAFSPLEVWHGARTLGMGVLEFLHNLRDAGLDTLPGTAAEILDDEVRAIICPDKINTEQWIDIAAAAHEAGMPTTSTIMFGHVERPRHWARHLLRLRALQARTGGITEFVPLPFVHMETPLYCKGVTRKGPTFREAVLMHAVARLALHPHITNIQTSWTKMGPDGAGACLGAGANDLGGTLMNESISRAAGAAHGQEMPPARMESLIRSLDRTPRQRTTLYGDATIESVNASFHASALSPIENTEPTPRKPRRGRSRLVRAG